jgi:protein-tyrosine phosphatase
VGGYVPTQPRHTTRESGASPRGAARTAKLPWIWASLVYSLLATLVVRTHMQRVIPLLGGRNFRDLGGYTTDEGLRVRWGRVYRSGVLSYLTEGDHRYLRKLGIRVLCDLRTRRERDREPVQWHGQGRIRKHWDYDPNQVSIEEDIYCTGFSAESARQAMVKLYAQLPNRLVHQYRWLFSTLAAGKLPLVFSCSAGKDRTGVAAALLLRCLGVPSSQVVADFVLTDRVVDLERIYFSAARPALREEGRSSPPRSVREALLAASPEYLDAAIDQIERDYGSVRGYVRRGLKITETQVTQIRSLLLEP